VDGVVVQLPRDGLVGPWLVAEQGGSLRVSVPASAIVDERVAPAAAGAKVRIVVDDTPDGPVAVRVRVEAAP
jgi:hypothetical protein